MIEPRFIEAYIGILCPGEGSLMTLRTVLVSTFPPLREGIAIYSFSLAEALTKHDEVQLTVLSTLEYSGRKPTNFKVVKTWKQNSPEYPFSISKEVARTKANLIHVQHEYALYGSPLYSGLFPILLLIIKLMRKKLVVTMHSIILESSLSPDFFGKYGAGKNLVKLKKLLVIGVTKLIGHFSDAIIVHQRLAKRELSTRYGIDPSKIHVIPHGVESCSTIMDPIRSKAKLNIQGPTIFCFGFLRRGRGIEYAIKALKIVAEKHSNVKLIIAGGAHQFSMFEGIGYVDKLKNTIRELNLSKNVVFINRYIHEKELPFYFSLADMFVLPYAEEGIIGASGVMSKILCYGKPIVFTKVYRFSELWNLDSMLVVEPESVKSLSNALLQLLDSPSLQKRVGMELRKIAFKESWDNVARKTLSLYRKILE
jgi:glycosyltransferase involved in cell wall biosynthesis